MMTFLIYDIHSEVMDLQILELPEEEAKFTYTRNSSVFLHQRS